MAAIGEANPSQEDTDIQSGIQHKDIQQSDIRQSGIQQSEALGNIQEGEAHSETLEVDTLIDFGPSVTIKWDGNDTPWIIRKDVAIAKMGLCATLFSQNPPDKDEVLELPTNSNMFTGESIDFLINFVAEEGGNPAAMLVRGGGEICEGEKIWLGKVEYFPETVKELQYFFLTAEYFQVRPVLSTLRYVATMVFDCLIFLGGTQKSSGPYMLSTDLICTSLNENWGPDARDPQQGNELIQGLQWLRRTHVEFAFNSRFDILNNYGILVCFSKLPDLSAAILNHFADKGGIGAEYSSTDGKKTWVVKEYTHAMAELSRYPDGRPPTFDYFQHRFALLNSPAWMRWVAGNPIHMEIFWLEMAERGKESGGGLGKMVTRHRDMLEKDLSRYHTVQ